MADHGHLGENEGKFQKFESKIDEVMSLLKSMTPENGDLTTSSTTKSKQPPNMDKMDSLSKKYKQFECVKNFTCKLYPID